MAAMDETGAVEGAELGGQLDVDAEGGGSAEAAEGAEGAEVAPFGRRYEVVYCRGCGVRMRVEVRGGLMVKQWCGGACKIQASRCKRMLMIADALEGTKAQRMAALKALEPAIERARGMAALRAERIKQQGGRGDEARQEAKALTSCLPVPLVARARGGRR